MPLVLLTGPEKAGKTTLARALVAEWDKRFPFVGSFYRHWSAISHDDEYAAALKEDRKLVASGQLVVWDRGWPCEHVYSQLLPETLDTGRNQKRILSRLYADPWLGEWLYGRAFDMKVIVTREPEQLTADRDETDLPCDPEEEYNKYVEYGQRFGYLRISGINTPEASAVGLLNRWDRAYRQRLVYPEYVGPSTPVVTVVAEPLAAKPGFRGAYLPFTSRLAIPLGRIIGDKALQIGWADIGQRIDSELVLACGSQAAEWCYHVYGDDPGKTIVYSPHPSFVFRNNGGRADKARDRLEELGRWLRDSVIGNPNWREEVNGRLEEGWIEPYIGYAERRRRQIADRMKTGSNKTGVTKHG